MKTIYIATLAAVVAASVFADENAKTGKQRMIERTGGFIEQVVPADAKTISLIDGRKAGGDELKNFQKDLDFAIHAPSVLGKADNAAITLTLVDEGDFIVNPIKGTAVVPVGKTAEETKEALYKAVFCILSTDASILSMEGQQISFNALAARKIPERRKVTYKLACEEGWAPAPTNDIQKAVWEKVKAKKAKAAAEAAKATETPAAK